MRTTILCALGAAAFGSAPAAMAQDDFCPDRPGLGTPACTVGDGRVAIELGLAGWARDEEAGMRSESLVLGDLLVRYGIGPATEVQLGWTAHGELRERGGAVRSDISGSGDLLVAMRQTVHAPEGFALAVMPYATLPTGGAAIGTGDWGAGLIVPMSWNLDDGFGLGVTANIDAAVDEDRDGRHLAYGGIVGLDVPIGDSVGATFELAALRDKDPAGASTQWLAGVSGGWSPAPDLQLDAGANFGLDRDAADIELYIGLARRF